MNYSLSMQILQARILEWVALPSSRGSSQPRGRTQLSCIEGGLFTVWATREAFILCKLYQTLPCPSPCQLGPAFLKLGLFVFFFFNNNFAKTYQYQISSLMTIPYFIDLLFSDYLQKQVDNHPKFVSDVEADNGFTHQERWEGLEHTTEVSEESRAATQAGLKWLTTSKWEGSGFLLWPGEGRWGWSQGKSSCTGIAGCAWISTLPKGGGIQAFLSAAVGMRERGKGEAQKPSAARHQKLVSDSSLRSPLPRQWSPHWYEIRPSFLPLKCDSHAS